MRNPLRALGPRWQVARRRHPQATGTVQDALAGAAGPARLAGEVRVLRTRLAELERDHLLLAAHVATLTAQAARGASAALADPDEEAARQRARLAAVAWYEQRIADLEDRVGVGRARAAAASSTSSGTSGERQGWS